MKYVHAFNGMEHEAAAGALNRPWLPAEGEAEADERVEAARERARAHVAATVEAATAPDEPVKRSPGRPKKADEGSPDA